MPTYVAESSVSDASAVALFARNFFKHPSMLGSVIPSSSFVVKDLMARVDWERARVLLEFGPGVGTITREMLKRMRPDAVLLAIELNSDFVNYLNTTVRDARLRVIHGSAVHVRSILADHGFASADCIISSIPYSLLPARQRHRLVVESRRVLHDEGSLLVYQYSRRLLPHLKSSFGSVKLNIQFLNILPALIFHCKP